MRRCFDLTQLPGGKKPFSSSERIPGHNAAFTYYRILSVDIFSFKAMSSVFSPIVEDCLLFAVSLR